MDPLFFWRETEELHGFLSQWYPSLFTAPSLSSETPTSTSNSPLNPPSPETITFGCTEQYMMYRKALLFSDHATAAKILRESKPRNQQKLGRGVRGFDRERWDEAKSGIVEEGNWWKFSRAKGDLKGKLLETGERELVEASPRDRIWGVGFGAANAEKMRAEWGENLLGKALMRVRERLRKEEDGKGKGRAHDHTR